MSAPDPCRGTVLRGAALVLTMDPDMGEGPLGALAHADVLMEDGVITAVGPDLRRGPGTEAVDARGRIVLPGFVDAHTHLWQSAIRGHGAELGFYDWYGTCVGPVLPVIAPEEMDRFVRLSAADALQSGVTTVVDWVPAVDFAVSEAYVRAVDESGLRFVHAPYQELPDIGLVRKVVQDLVTPTARGTAQVGSAAFPGYADTVRAHADLARELGVGLNLHLLEHPDDRAGDPVGMLDEAGALGPRTLLNHVIHITGAELDLLARRGAAVAHCPLSNMRLATGVMPLPEFRRRGIRAGLGQDGGTNDSGDMFASMKAAVGLQRAVSLDAGAYPGPREALAMATLDGARAIGEADRLGSLTPGKRADVVVLEPRALNFAPRGDWPAQLVLNGRPDNVTDVYVDGIPRKSGGRLAGVDVPRLVADAEAAADRVWA
ncbi:amidohydrolase family protein [Nocardiopsis sp. NPDC101807]|uniref:amidohydrolase family protein n=1 Tax=Nocardiopsis sp. NPDC101807 TaxID=3364339 RepID=UPI0037FD1FB3